MLYFIVCIIALGLLVRCAPVLLLFVMLIVAALFGSLVYKSAQLPQATEQESRAYTLPPQTAAEDSRRSLPHFQQD